MSPAISNGYACLLNGSLHEKASSQHFLKRAEKLFASAGVAVTPVAVQPGAAQIYSEATLQLLNEASLVVLASPVYSYSLPGSLMRLLEAWARYAGEHSRRAPSKFYGIVNCGFVVPETMAEAVRVLEHFCARSGLDYRFTVAIACGVVAVVTEPVDLRLRRAYRAIVEDALLDRHEKKPTIYIKPLVPRIVMDTIREHFDRRVLRDVRRAAARAEAVAARTEAKI